MVTRNETDQGQTRPAAIVFDCGRPITAMGLDVTHQVLSTRARVDRIRQLGCEVDDWGDLPVKIPETQDAGDPRLKYLGEILEVVTNLRDCVERAKGEALTIADEAVRVVLESELQDVADEFGDVAFVAILTLAVSFAATLYPAWKATTLDPVEAIRYE